MSDFYEIAGLTVEISGIDDPYFGYRLGKYRANGKKADIHIEYSEEEKISEPAGQPAGRDSYRVFLKTDAGYANYDLLENPSMITAKIEADEKWENIKASLCDVEPYGGASLSVRAFNMVGEIMKTVFAKHDGVVIHSSSLAYKNKGILFSAPSGTGKSTHTGLWEKVYGNDVEIINDDMPAVRKIDGIWHLCGTPWSGKSEKNVNKNVPLCGLVFLERGEKNEIHKISGAQSIFKIMNQTMLPVYKDIMDTVMDNIGGILSKTDAYILKCTISDEAPVIVKEAIFREDQR